MPGAIMGHADDKPAIDSQNTMHFPHEGDKIYEVFKDIVSMNLVYRTRTDGKVGANVSDNVNTRSRIQIDAISSGNLVVAAGEIKDQDGVSSGRLKTDLQTRVI
tara:strand:- start:274 stop:585 length:312 start_codon:yes stop_codon:yes gene_type:complete